MYISLIVDNAADRKQLERLMDRAATFVKATTGDLYIESFGTPASALNAPLKYGLFILDLTSDTNANTQTIESLLKAQVPGTIALCYQEDGNGIFSQLPDGILTISKPLRQQDLNLLVTDAFLRFRQKNASLKIELRGKEKTYYVDPDDIILAKGGANSTSVHLKDGFVVTIPGYFDDVRNNVLNYPRYQLFHKNLLINRVHVSEIKRNRITLDNGLSFSLPFYAKNPFLKG